MATKEIQDVFYVAKVVILAIVREIAKDGFQPMDLLAFIKTSEFEAALKGAMDGATQVPEELMDLSLMDDLSLARYVYNMAMDIVGEIKAYKKA